MDLFSIYYNQGPSSLVDDKLLRIRIYILMDMYRSKYGTKSN